MNRWSYIGTGIVTFHDPFRQYYGFDMATATRAMEAFAEVYNGRDVFDEIPPTETELFLAHRRRLAELRGTFVPLPPAPARPGPSLVAGRGATRTRKGGRS